MKIAFLVPAPDYPDPWLWAFEAEAAALQSEGASVEAVPWPQAGGLQGFDLILPLVAWGYHERYAEWLALVDRLEQLKMPLLNPPALLRWNSDKDYLTELPEKGVPTIPTLVTDKLDETLLAAARAQFETDELVVKPTVSASAFGTYRLGQFDAVPDVCRGRRMIVQPFEPGIATSGEYSLMLFNGVFSHAVVKRPKSGDFRVQPHLGGVTVACDPPAGSEDLAIAALAAAPAPATYARVDMVRGRDGELRIMELELIEPALFLHLAADGGAAFAEAIIGAAIPSVAAA